MNGDGIIFSLYSNWRVLEVDMLLKCPKVPYPAL